MYTSFEFKFLQPFICSVSYVSVHFVTQLSVTFQNGANDIKNHRWFRGFNWDDVYDKKIEVRDALL